MQECAIVPSTPMSSRSLNPFSPVDRIFMLEWHREAAILRRDFPELEEGAIWEALRHCASLLKAPICSESAALILERARNRLAKQRLENRQPSPSAKR